MTRIWQFGDPRFTPDGVALPGKYRDSYCIFKFPKKIESIKEAIHFVHNILLSDPGLKKTWRCLRLKKAFIARLMATERCLPFLS